MGANWRGTADRWAEQTLIIPAGTPHAWGTHEDEGVEIVFAWGGPDPFADAVYLEGEPPKQS